MAAQQRIADQVTANVPMTDAGLLDATALTGRVEEARRTETAYIASLSESGAADHVAGLGASHGTQPTETVVTEAIAATFGRTVKGN